MTASSRLETNWLVIRVYCVLIRRLHDQLFL